MDQKPSKKTSEQSSVRFLPENGKRTSPLPIFVTQTNLTQLLNTNSSDTSESTPSQQLTKKPQLNEQQARQLGMPNVDFLTFEYKTLSVDELGQLGAQIIGPVLGFGRSCAISQQAGAILLDLGGKPSLDPARGEPPGHYNLIWNSQTVAAAGHHIMEKKLGAGYIKTVSLSIKVPQVMADKVEHIKELFQAGMTALFQGTMPELTDVKVIFDSVSYV